MRNHEHHSPDVPAQPGGGCAPPVIRNQPGHLWGEFSFSAEYLAVIPADAIREDRGEKWGVSLTARRRKIVEAMRRNARITIPELAAELGRGNTAIDNH